MRPLLNSRLVNWGLVLAVGLAVWLSFRFLALDMGGLFSADSLALMAEYIGRFLTPDLSESHLQAIGRGALETLAMSAMGTLLAVVFGLLLALPAAGRQGRQGRQGRLALSAARLVLNVLRAIPELVWAVLMVLAVGLGPNAGTLALALHTAGVLGRLFAEALENTPVEPADAVRLAGGGRIAAFCYGTLPCVWPQLMAYTLYRWENNIRMASVLGFVGAGGLGQMLYVSLSLFQEAQAASLILAMLILVMGVDGFSGWVRQRWVVA